MAVTLQVIGIYYKQLINTDNIPGYEYSVQSILNAAQDQTGPNGQTFSYIYSQAQNGDYVDFMSATYPGDAISPVSGTAYNPGTYGLTQSFTSLNGNTYTVWQYYIFDENNTVVPAGSSPETPFSQGNPVRDGYTIVWRLVSICGALPVMNARLSKLIGKPFPKA